MLETYLSIFLTSVFVENIERVRLIPTVAGWIAQQRDDFMHLEECSGPAVGDHQRHGVRSLTLFVDEVNAKAINFRLEMRK